MDFTRRVAIGMSLGIAARNAMGQQRAQDSGEGEQFFLRLVNANDQTVGRMLQQPKSGSAEATRAPGQRLGRGANIAAMMAAYCSPQSKHFRAMPLLSRMEQAAQAFVDALDSADLLDAGNLSSPPDTGFVVEALAASLNVARRSQDQRLQATQQRLSDFLLRVGNALVSGGIHTPNHRWVVCSALSRIHALFPNPQYVNRIDDWLGEGIYQDVDGLFPERSPNYARVEVNAFLTMARLLNRPALLDPVRKYLQANLYLMQPDGEIEVINSRRQDQTRPLHVDNFYVEYRYMAIRDTNPTFAAVARLIAERSDEGLVAGERMVEGSNPVIHFLDEDLLRQSLPGGGEIPSDYRKVFTNSKLVRVRRNNRTASIYGGSDWPLGVASGLAHNPTFFNFRKGNAILDSVRMGGRFFSLGVFRAEDIQVNDNAAVLQQRLEAPYYQPLPRDHRKPNGDYPLTPVRDERFWSKLDFPHREISNVQVLQQKVTITETEDAFELLIEVTGRERVPYAMEFAFRPGGEFGGAIREVELLARNSSLEDKIWFLEEGMGSYRVGEDAITFGPGQADHEVVNLSGHSYQAHGASLRASGHCVYITDFTPFRKQITIRGL